MKKRSKKYKKSVELVDKSKTYNINDAIAVLKQMPTQKFDQSVDMVIHLTVDPKKTDQMVRGTVVLPHGLGKSKKVAVFCQGESEREAKDAGADFIGGKELIDKVAGGWLDFDCAVSTPDMMRDLSKLGRILGPRGLMPSPKTGTVTKDVANAVKELKAGKIEFKADKQGGIAVSLGRISFSEDKLIDNIKFFVNALKQSKPSSAKGEFIKAASLSCTMSPGLRVVL